MAFYNVTLERRQDGSQSVFPEFQNALLKSGVLLLQCSYTT